MSDLDKLQDAFLKADALARQGDTQAKIDAQLFADEIKRLSAGGASKPESQIMPQLNKGISETVGGLVDFLNPFDEPHALNPFPEGTGSAVTGIENLMDAGGIKVAQGEPQGLGEAFARGSGQAAGSLIPVVKGLSALRNAGGAVGQFADDAYKALTGYLAPGAEVVAGGVSGGAEELAEEAGAPEWVQNTVAVAAPMSIPAAVAAAKGVAKVTPVGIAARRAASAVAPFTKSGAKGVATERMQTLAGGRERAEELAGRVSGENPLDLTPAQQTQDPNMLAIEKLAAEQDPVLRETLARRQAKTSAAAQQQIDAMGGDVEDAQRFLGQRQQEILDNLQEKIDTAQNAANERAGSIAGRFDASENSAEVMDSIDRALGDALTEEKRLWDAIDRDAVVSTSAAKAKAGEWEAELGRSRADNMPSLARRLLLDDDGYSGAESVRELHGLYSQMREVARNAMAGNNQQKTLAKVANEIADAILEDLGATAGTSPVGRQINEARTFSANLHSRFDQGEVGRLRKRTVDGDTNTDPRVALDRSVGRGGASAMVSSEQLEDAGGLSANFAIKDYIAGRFNQSVMKDGVVSQAAARQFIAKNKELLNRYPDLRDDINTAVAQKVSADELAERLTKRISAFESERQNATARFIGGSAEKAVQAILKADNPIQAARRIAREARRDGSGEALAGVKGAITTHLIEGTLKTKAGQTAMDANSLASLLSDPKLTSAMRQIFSESELTRLKAISRELTKAQSRTSANVGEELSGAQAPRWLEVMARITGAKVGSVAANARDAGTSLQAAQLGSGTAKNIIGRLTADRASQMIAESVTDPELFKALLTQTGSVKAVDRAIPKFIPYLVGAGSAALE